jgi:hypothetical protein
MTSASNTKAEERHQPPPHLWWKFWRSTTEANMTTKKTYRQATLEEIEQINKDADEAERLYFESGLAAVPQVEAESRQPLQADIEADQPVIVDKTKCDQRQ